MKKRLFLVWIVLGCLIPQMFSQGINPLNRAFSFGPKVAFTMSELKLNSDFLSSFEPGMDVGVFVRVGYRFYFQPEVLYSFQNSTTFSGLINEFDQNMTLKTHYLQIPLQFGYSLVNNTNFKLRLFLGPKVGFLMKEEQELTQENLMADFACGGIVGLGIDLWRFTLDAGYNFQFAKNLIPYTNVPEKFLKSNLFSISLGFKCF